MFPAPTPPPNGIGDFSIATTGPEVLIDANGTTTATNDGILTAAEYENRYSRGINIGFLGGAIGSGLIFIDADASGAVNIGLERGRGDLDHTSVIYIDSVPGGFADTTAFTDDDEPLRGAISAIVDGGRSDLVFAPGFAADYAIAFDKSFAGLWQLVAGGSHTFIRSLNLQPTNQPDAAEFEFGGALADGAGLLLSDIGLAPGDFFDYVVTYWFEGLFRSIEYHGVAQSTVPSDSTPMATTTLADGDFNSFVSPGPCSKTLALTQNLWRMFSTPCDTADSVETLFVNNGNLAATDYGSTWIVYARDESANDYLELTLADTIDNGRGYWVKTLDSGRTVGFNGGRIASPAVESLVSDAAGRFNMMGHPYNIKVDWADVLVVDGDDVLTLSQADPGGACQGPEPLVNGCVMSSVAYKWTGAAYESFNGATPGLEGGLLPGEAFWVKAYKENISLRVPLVPARTASTAAKAAQPQGGIRSRGWQVQLTAESGSLYDNANFFGQLAGSADEYDPSDLPELAPFGPTYLSVVFPREQWGVYAGDYTSDHRRIGDHGANEWRFEVRTSEPPGTEVTLRWEGPPVRALAGAVLLDYDNNRKVTADPSGSYTFTATSPVHHFGWLVVPVLPE